MALADEDRALFDSTVSAYLREHYDDAARRRVSESEEGWSRDHWHAFAELGLLAAGFDEADGGLGGGMGAHALILEHFGRALVVEPYLPTAVIGGGFLRHGTMAGAADWIAKLIAGDLTIAFAHGEAATRYNPAHVTTTARRDGDVYRIDGSKAVVLNAAQANHLIVVTRTGGTERDAHGLSAFLVDASTAGITRRDYRTISGGSASDIAFADVAVSADRLLAPEGDALPLIERVLDEAAALVCIEAIGVMDRLLNDTLDYTKQRQQFGRALASFQVLQHRMVDMLSMKTQAAALARRTIGLLDAPAEQRAQAVSAAKVYVGKAARFLGQQAIQLHGGMGMTDELAVGFFFKRAIEIERQFGSIDHHLTRYERLAYRPVAA